jgi:cytochrome c-type biogenesis protein CcmF
VRPNRGYYPVNAPFAPISSAFDGESTSEVGLDAGLKRDVWTSMQPDLTSFTTFIKNADKTLVAAARKAVNVDPARYGQVRRAYFQAIIDRYERNTPPATFRFIVSPLVAWIWIGGLIVFGGGLIALWPAPDAVRRRATAARRARVAKELGELPI